MRISDWSSDVCSSDLVLQGSSMEHEIGLRFGEQAVDPLAVAHVADEGAARQLREALRELEVDAVKVEFGIVANGQMSRAERRNLPRQQIGRAHVELQSLMRLSYAVFCLKKKKTQNTKT